MQGLRGLQSSGSVLAGQVTSSGPPQGVTALCLADRGSYDTDQKGCSRFPPLCCLHRLYQTLTSSTGREAAICCRGDGLELGEVLSSAAPNWENGKTPLCIDSWE